MKVLKIKVKYFAGFRTITGKKEEKIEIPQKTTISRLLEKLKIPGGEKKLILINGNRQPDNYHLKENDEVSIFPPIGGG